MDRKRIESEITQLSHHLDARTICSSPNARDVDKCLDLLNEVDAYLTHSVFGNDRSADLEPSIVVLGTTGAGKSTIVSFLVGEGRTVVRHESRYARALIADPPLPDVNIRSGEVSVSLLPTVTHATMGGEVVAVWDMPGYRDTRGPFVELVVHFIFKWMLKVDKPVKFILVTPPLHERPQTVMLQNMINGSLIRKDNAVIVYTKCGRDFDPESTSDLNIEENKREIRSFALPAPAQSDEDGHDYSLQYCARKDEMLKTLSGLHSYKVEYDEKLPDAAKLLLEALTKTCVQFVQEELSKCFLCKFKWDLLKGSFEEITDMLETLKCTEDITLKTMVDILARIAPSDYDYAPEFYCAKRRLSIVETMNGGETRRHLYDWLNEECRRLLEKTKEKLLDLRNAVKTYSLTLKTDDTLVISAFQLRLSDELERIEKFVRKREVAIDSVEAIPNVIIVGHASLDVDVGIQMWTNIALVSPSIRVTAVREFDLSAIGQGKCAERLNSVAGQDGAHGEPGLRGGNLTAVCQKLKDDSHILRSTVSCGQSGGDAQNGGEGVDGTDSAYSKATFEEAIERNAKLHHLKDNSTVPRDLEEGLQLVMYEENEAPTGLLYRTVCGVPVIAHLRIAKESESGTSRIQAGNGGQGGAGGLGGNIRILLANQIVWEGAGLMGQKGLDGNPGKASRDGNGSPSFIANTKQWYWRGGWFGDIFEPKIDFQVEEVKAEDQPNLVHAKVAQGNGIILMNDGLGLDMIKAAYQTVRTELEDCFPQCDFSDSQIGWEDPIRTA